MPNPVKHNPQTLIFRPVHTGEVLVESVQIPNVPSDGDMTATLKSGLPRGPFAVSVQSFDVVRIVATGGIVDETLAGDSDGTTPIGVRKGQLVEIAVQLTDVPGNLEDSLVVSSTNNPLGHNWSFAVPLVVLGPVLRYCSDASGNEVSRAPETILPPQIIERAAAGQPVNQVAEPGDVATFSVVVADALGATFQWMFNGTNISGATGDSLILTGVSPANEGQYSVIVTNSAGTATSTPATLRVARSVAAPAGLVGWWKGEGNARDSAGANHGVLPPSVTADPDLPSNPDPPSDAGFALSKVGQAFSFDGSQVFVKIPDAPALRPPSLTLEAWVTFAKVAAIYVLFTKAVGSAAGTNNSYALWVDFTVNGQLNTDGTLSNFGVLKGAVGDPTHPENVLSSSPFSFELGRWYHLAYTFRPPSGIPLNRHLYVDGVQVAAGRGGGHLDYDSNPLLLGIDPTNPPGLINRFGPGPNVFSFHGRIDEASLYNRELSASEIAAIHSAGSRGKVL